MELDNVTTGSGAEPESAETFHIYILSFAYGILIVVVLGHLVVRWHWRRKKLSHFRPHTPGDKSFRSKGIRERISADFTAIKAISPDPRLVSDSFKPSDFGANSDGAGVTPPHWYRMKAFDVAADFVATNSPLLRTPTPPHPSPLTAPPLSLPDFLAVLQERGVAATLEGGAVQADHCCQLYSHARYKDGKFGQAEFEEFSSLMTQLQSRLSPDVPSSPSSSLAPPSRTVSPTVPAPGRHTPLVTQSSLEPLLSSSSSTASPDAVSSHPPKHPSSHSKPSPGGRSSSRSSSSSKRARPPPELEVLPLVSPSLSEQPFSPTGSEGGGGLARLSGCETPV